MRIPLSLAISAYDHARELCPQGIGLEVLDLPIEEIFYRFTRLREWDAGGGVGEPYPPLPSVQTLGYHGAIAQLIRSHHDHT